MTKKFLILKVFCNYIQILLIIVSSHQHNQYLVTEDKEEILRDNERNFVEAYESPQGPFKFMSP